MNYLSSREAVSSASKYTKCHTSSKPLHYRKIESRNGHPSKERTVKQYLHLKTKHRKSVASPIEMEPQPVLIRKTIKMTRNTARHLKTNGIYHEGIKTSADDEKYNSIRKPLRERHQMSQVKTNQLSKNEQSKVQLMSRGKNYLVKRLTHNLQNDKLIVINKPLQVELMNLRYYISEIKNNMQEFVNNQEQINQHLSHLEDSVSVFQMLSHIPIPKDMPRPVNLPLPQIGKITLVFDLDETLIHTQVINWDTNKDDLGWGKNIEVASQMGSYMINLKIRPYVKEVLDRLKEKFQIGIFSASQEVYGKAVLQQIDPHGQIFSFQLYRQHCFEIQSRSAHIKDLRIMKDRDLGRVILIDNSPHTYLFQKSNAIPIVSFLNDRDDKEMLKLEEFLMQMTQVKDIRRILKQYFKLERYHHYNHVKDLVKQLYQ